MKEHRVVQTVPWATDPEPQSYYLSVRYSPDGKLLYAFLNEIIAYDATTLKQLDSWNLSLPNEPGLGRFDLNAMDDVNDEPGFFTGLFAMEDAVQKRRLLGVGRVDLQQKKLDYFPIGPSPDRGDVSFAMTPDRKRGYMMIEEIGHHEMWTIDIARKRLESRAESGAAADGSEDQLERQADLPLRGRQHDRSLRSRGVQVPPDDQLPEDMM